MLQTLTVATVSSLPNISGLGTLTKIQTFDRAPDTSFNGEVLSEVLVGGVKCLETKRGRRGFMKSELIFYGRARLRVRMGLKVYNFKFIILSITIIRGREKVFTAWNA